MERYKSNEKFTFLLGKRNSSEMISKQMCCWACLLFDISKPNMIHRQLQMADASHTGTHFIISFYLPFFNIYLLFHTFFSLFFFSWASCWQQIDSISTASSIQLRHHVHIKVVGIRWTWPIRIQLVSENLQLQSILIGLLLLFFLRLSSRLLLFLFFLTSSPPTNGRIHTKWNTFRVFFND